MHDTENCTISVLVLHVLMYLLMSYAKPPAFAALSAHFSKFSANVRCA